MEQATTNGIRGYSSTLSLPVKGIDGSVKRVRTNSTGT